jgi:hypothetical protein
LAEASKQFADRKKSDGQRNCYAGLKGNILRLHELNRNELALGLPRIRLLRRRRRVWRAIRVFAAILCVILEHEKLRAGKALTRDTTH